VAKLAKFFLAKISTYMVLILLKTAFSVCHATGYFGCGEMMRHWKLAVIATYLHVLGDFQGSTFFSVFTYNRLLLQ
jgi:hypothetical protein